MYSDTRETLSSTGELRQVPLANVALGGIFVTAGLILYSVIQYPLTIRGAGLWIFFATLLGLLIYAGTAAWIWRQPPADAAASLAKGTKYGALLAVCSLASLAIQYVATDAGTNTVRGIILWALLFGLLGAAGSAAMQTSGSVRAVLLTAVWCSIIGTTATLLVGFAFGQELLPGMQRLTTAYPCSVGPDRLLEVYPCSVALEKIFEQYPCNLSLPYLGASACSSAEFVRSGVSDAHAYAIQRTLTSACTQVFVIPLLACVIGALGGATSRLLRTFDRTVIIAMGLFETILFLAGAFALWHASSLLASERMPFIVAGLVVMALAAGCAHPIFTTLRRRNRDS